MERKLSYKFGIQQVKSDSEILQQAIIKEHKE